MFRSLVRCAVPQEPSLFWSLSRKSTPRWIDFSRSAGEGALLSGTFSARVSKLNKNRRLTMTKDERRMRKECRMSNDVLKTAREDDGKFRHSDFGLLSDFVIRHLS